MNNIKLSVNDSISMLGVSIRDGNIFLNSSLVYSEMSLILYGLFIKTDELILKMQWQLLNGIQDAGFSVQFSILEHCQSNNSINFRPNMDGWPWPFGSSGSPDYFSTPNPVSGLPTLKKLPAWAVKTPRVSLLSLPPATPPIGCHDVWWRPTGQRACHLLAERNNNLVLPSRSESLN